MKNKIVRCVLAAAVSGAVFFSEPEPVLAALAEQLHVDEGVPAVEGWESENYSDRHYAVWTNRLEANQKLCIEWSLKSDFTLENGYLTLDGTAGEYCLSDHFQKGHTYYVRSYIMETARVSDRQGGWEEVKKYGPYSRTVIMEQRAPEAEVVDFTVEGDSVTMRLESAEPATGFEIQRAEGAGRYRRIAKISDNVYTDTGLTEGRTYRYRIRTFVFEPKTRLTAYGAWKNCRATTWGQELRVKAVPSGTRAVKVTWNRVPGATGYRIYRAAGISRTQSVKKGKKSRFRSLRLLKTMNSPSSRTFQDKKVKAGETYTYFVTAYREGKTEAQALKTYVLQGTDSVTLDYGKLEVIRKRRRPDGSVRLTWKKKPGVDGYLIKKKNPATGAYEKYRRLSGQAGACVFPAAEPGLTDQYLLYAYRGNVFGNGVEVSTSGCSLGKTENIQAYATVDGQGVQISWSRVPGASFYKVYRSRMLAAYDGDTDSYDFKGADAVKVIKEAGGGVTDEIRATYAVDQRLELTAGNTPTLLNQGPEQGLVYYYYVQAFQSDGSRVTGAALHGKPARVLLNMYFPKPSIISVKSTAKGRITVKWNGVEGAAKYFVYRAEKKGGDYVLAGKTAKTGFTDKKAAPGRKYYYRVKAYRPNAVGADLYSEASKAWGAVARGGR